MPERTLRSLHIDVTLRAPWLVHGTAPTRFGLNDTQMRDHLGRLILPGQLLVGRLRAAWHEMQAFGLPTEDARHWFGQPGPEPDHRARVWIDDLSLDPNTPPSISPLASPRVAIDDASGAAQDAQLRLAEQNHPPGQPLRLSGTWHAALTDDETKRLEAALQAGLLWHSQLGAERSVGFGVVLRAKVKASAANPPVRPSEVPNGRQARLVLTITAPLCVDTRSIGGNLFVSGDTLSGGTLKGALATQLRARYGKSVEALRSHNALARQFDGIRITHAFPAAKDARPAALPQSLAAHGAELFDLATFITPQLIDGRAPAFHHDWKPAIHHAARAEQGWGATRPHLRVRTAIYGEHHDLDGAPFEPQLAGQAWENKLFAYECRVAENNTRWLADIHLPDALSPAECAAIWEALADLIAPGLGPLGKTDAFAQAQLRTSPPNVWPQRTLDTLVDGDVIPLQLNTPALLFPSSSVADRANPDLLALYRDAFRSLSGSALELSHFFASQRMAGGNYLLRRHLAARPGPYRPLVLTEPGSVFMLEIVNADAARPLLANWQGHGLPLPAAVKNECGDTWKDHPYLPQNGYGEIALAPRHGFNAPAYHRLTAC